MDLGLFSSNLVGCESNASDKAIETNIELILFRAVGVDGIRSRKHEFTRTVSFVVRDRDGDLVKTCGGIAARSVGIDVADQHLRQTSHGGKQAKNAFSHRGSGGLDHGDDL